MCMCDSQCSSWSLDIELRAAVCELELPDQFSSPQIGSVLLIDPPSEPYHLVGILLHDLEHRAIRAEPSAAVDQPTDHYIQSTDLLISEIKDCEDN